MTEKPVALIVGGGSGIGADAARKLAERGYDVGVMSSSGKGEALGNELGGIGFTGSNLVVADLEKFTETAAKIKACSDGESSRHLGQRHHGFPSSPQKK